MRRISLAALVRSAALGLFLSGLSPVRLAAQDFTVHMKSLGDNETSTSYISPTAVRYTTSAGQDIILRLDQRKSIDLNHQKKSYSEIPLDKPLSAADRGGNEAKSADPRVQQAMARMGFGSGEAKLTRLGAGETIAGYATEKYSLTTPMMQMEISAAPSLSVPPAYYDAVKPLSGSSDPRLAGMAAMFSEMKKIKGMVLKQVSTLSIMGRTITMTSVATRVDRSPIAASTFEVPAGYRLSR